MAPSQPPAKLDYLHPSSQYCLPTDHFKITVKLKTLPVICWTLELTFPLGEL